MVRTVLDVDGMACGMCEAHVNDAVRRAFPVRKVSSSHLKGRTEILSEDHLDVEKLVGAVNATGYTVRGVREETAEKKRFSFFGNR